MSNLHFNLVENQNSNTCQLKKNYAPLSEREQFLGKEIVDAAFKVHNELGPGLLERIYEACFCYELKKKGINFKRQADLQLIHYLMTH